MNTKQTTVNRTESSGPGPHAPGAEDPAQGPGAARSIALLGVTRNTDNYGVRVLLSAAVDLLARAHPEHAVVVLDYGKQPESWVEASPARSTPVRLLNLRFSWKLLLANNVFLLFALAILRRGLPGPGKAWLERRNRSLAGILAIDDFFALSGGDSFSDIYGLRRLLYVAMPQLLVLALGKRLVLLPQTYGPFRSGAARFLARAILRRAAGIYSRDERGRDVVHALMAGEPAEVVVVPDIGLSLRAAALPESVANALRELKTHGTVIGLNPSSLLMMGGYNQQNMFALRVDFAELIGAIAAHVTGALRCRLLLVPHVCGGPASQEDETRVCERLVHELQGKGVTDVHYFRERLDHRQTKALIGQCDVFIGGRMHACVAAVSQGVPAVCLAYSDKFAGVMKPLGEAAGVLDLRETSIPEALEQIGEVIRRREVLHRQLTEVTPGVQTAIEQAFQRPTGFR
jgi:colanic acid/amylovoran biosynthesis protein